ncbi:MAG: hypothetical protein LBL66_09815 [Clostridiales bacterium]|nr:hypothetical protein [Clostridiales bacterium]
MGDFSTSFEMTLGRIRNDRTLRGGVFPCPVEIAASRFRAPRNDIIAQCPLSDTSQFSILNSQFSIPVSQFLLPTSFL